MAVLAALAMDEILKNPKVVKGLVKPLGWGAVLAALLVSAFALSPRLGAGKFYAKFSDHAASMEISLLICGLTLGLLSLISFFTQRRPFWRYGFVILSCLELFCFAKTNLPFFQYKDYTDKIEQIQKVYRQAPGDYRVLVGNFYALSAGGSDIWGEDPVIPSRYASFVALTQHCDPNSAFLQKFTFREFPQALGLLRLRYKFSEDQDALKVEPIKLIEAPRAFLADHWELLPREDAVRKAASPGFDWKREVLVRIEPGH